MYMCKNMYLYMCSVYTCTSTCRCTCRRACTCTRINIHTRRPFRTPPISQHFTVVCTGSSSIGRRPRNLTTSANKGLLALPSSSQLPVCHDQPGVPHILCKTNVESFVTVKAELPRRVISEIATGRKCRMNG